MIAAGLALSIIANVTAVARPADAAWLIIVAVDAAGKRHERVVAGYTTATCRQASRKAKIRLKGTARVLMFCTDKDPRR